MQSEDLRGQDADIESHKRADYILERGMWKAVCRGCRFSVEHADRQRASILFRSHHRRFLDAESDAAILDLRAEPTGFPVGSGITAVPEQSTA